MQKVSIGIINHTFLEEYVTKAVTWSKPNSQGSDMLSSSKSIAEQKYSVIDGGDEKQMEKEISNMHIHNKGKGFSATQETRF